MSTSLIIVIVAIVAIIALLLARGSGPRVTTIERRTERREEGDDR